jgi:hypothetical protein
MVDIESDKNVLCRAFMKIVEDQYRSIYSLLKNTNKITPQLESDFIEFHKVVLETFEMNPLKFSMLKVYEKLPTNTWIPLYLELIKIPPEEDDGLTSEERIASLTTNPIFLDICKSIRNQKSH